MLRYPIPEKTVLDVHRERQKGRKSGILLKDLPDPVIGSRAKDFRQYRLQYYILSLIFVLPSPEMHWKTLSNGKKCPNPQDGLP